MSLSHEVRAFSCPPSCSAFPLLAAGTNIKMSVPVIIPRSGDTCNKRSRELAQESGGLALTGQEEAEYILLVSVTAPHSQSEPVSIEASAPFLPPCHSLDSLISLWKHAALKIPWVRQSIVLISTKIHLNMILEWFGNLLPAGMRDQLVSGWVQRLFKGN